jgi:predicted phage terminase large subunit-like protein
LWFKYGTDLKTRKKKGCKEVHIGTRWSIHDPIGKLEAMNEGNERAQFIKLPAWDEDHHSYFDYLHDVGFDDKYFQEAQDTIDEVSWLCVYMQQPIEREGLLFPESDLTRFFGPPPASEVPDEVYAFVDVAFGGADSLSMPIIYRYGDMEVIADWVFMAKADYEVTEPVVAAKIIAHKCQRVLFEANNGGDFYSRDVEELLKKEHYKCLITAKRAPNTQSKLGRIIQHSPVIKSFQYLDRSKYPSDGGYQRAMTELCSFTQTGKNRHDDAPDSLAGLATMARISMNAKISTHSRRDAGL